MGKHTISKQHTDPDFKFFYPPANWDRMFDSKEYSIYYSLLRKQYGEKEADLIWNRRNFTEERNTEMGIWEIVKNYKPENHLNIIGDLSWGLESIKSLNKPKDLV